MYSHWNETICFISEIPLVMLIDLVCPTSRLRVIKLICNPNPSSDLGYKMSVKYNNVVVATFLSSRMNHGLDCDRDLSLTV